MIEAVRQRSLGRAGAAAGVAALHVLLAYALLTGLAVDVGRAVGERIKAFDVIQQPPPPPPVSIPPPVKVDAREGAAAPPSLKARPTPVVAPRRNRRSPIAAVEKATKHPEGSNPRAGSSATPGPGTGAGGQGQGTGAGGQGTGTGSGVRPVRAQRISGRLDNSDYPRASLRAGIEGTVVVRYTVNPDGRVSGCRIIRSSANAELNATTCRLIEQRFRYRPARDASGIPVPDIVSRTYDWSLPSRRTKAGVP